MKKTRDILQQNLGLADIVFELLDSRIPLSSKNPEIDKIIGKKNRIVILNKSDLSNEEANIKWINYYKEKNITAILANALNNFGTDKIIDEANNLMEDKLNLLKGRGVKNRAIRAMIVGVPNVGKSTLINALAGRKSAKTGNRPGVTKGKQWIKLKGNLELLDTPGILWPKFDDQMVGFNLAYTGAIKDEIMDIETLALKFIEKLITISPTALAKRYDVEVVDASPLEIMDAIAIKRGCIIKGGEIDYSRVSHIVLDEFRRGIIGRITLELP